MTVYTVIPLLSSCPIPCLHHLLLGDKVKTTFPVPPWQFRILNAGQMSSIADTLKWTFFSCVLVRTAGCLCCLSLGHQFAVCDVWFCSFSVQSMRLKLIANNTTVERRFSSWIGGSILASLVSKPVLNSTATQKSDSPDVCIEESVLHNANLGYPRDKVKRICFKRSCEHFQ